MLETGDTVGGPALTAAPYERTYGDERDDIDGPNTRGLSAVVATVDT